MRVKLRIVVIVFTTISFLVCFSNFHFKNNINSKKLVLNNINLYQENKIFIQNDWYLTIPKLNLIKAPIKESIDEEILNSYVGHFPTSSYLVGNVCLAAHNAGFSVNYFQKLSQLENDDEIEYYYKNNIKKYFVVNKYIIDERDFTPFLCTDYDKLTLVTCISGSPSKRLCIEAICKEG